jgi:hypothetical protein
VARAVCPEVAARAGLLRPRYPGVYCYGAILTVCCREHRVRVAEVTVMWYLFKFCVDGAPTQPHSSASAEARYGSSSGT